MPAGRPRIIESPEEFEALAKAYFSDKYTNNQPITISGLALAVGLSSRESLDEYGRRPEFSDVVKQAKLRVTQAYEERLWGTSPTGAIFALKNIASWRDQQDVQHSGQVSILATPLDEAI
jgi:hypothetical protein